MLRLRGSDLSASAREARARHTHGAIAIALILVLLVEGLMVGGRQVIGPMLQAAAERREASGVGQVVYAMPDQVFCRRLMFDNATAALVERGLESCKTDLRKERPTSTGGFSWP
jgi:hypothetical protein